MKLTINPNGINDFHNRGPINIQVLAHEKEIEAGQWDQVTSYTISKYQARRIENHFCGISDCKCPAGGVVVHYPGSSKVYIDDQYWVEIKKSGE